MSASNVFKLAALASSIALGGAASAAIVITEVAPTGSSASYAADWFEVTNTGTSAVDLTGWKMDDNSNSFAAAVALRGIGSIAAGQSVIFIEGNATGSNDATLNASFKAAWFGSTVPAGLVVANYGGSGVGLGASGDAVNLFDANGTLMAHVDFGTATAGVSFDNAAGLNNTTLTQLSVAGFNGAFVSASGLETGSPGVTAAVPEPQAWALLLGGLLGVGLKLRRQGR